MRTLATGMLLAGLMSRPGAAVEPGQAPQTDPGITIGAAAVAPPPGLYMIDQAFYYGFKLTGPGAVPGPNVPRGFVPEAEADFYWVTDWKFLGATYSAYIAFPFVAESIESAPLAGFPGVSFAGMHNTFIAPVQLHWNLGNGFFAEAAFGLYVPDGTIGGPLGDSNTGSPYFTFQPQLVLSYFKDGWNLTANLYYEINTRNQRSGYTSGDVFHADLTATKRFGKWTFGPAAYYVAQTTSDSPGAAFDAALTAAIPVPGGIHGFDAGKFEKFAVGGLVGYDFGPVSLTVFATDEVFARASGGNTGSPFVPIIPYVSDTTSKGYTVFGRLAYRLWGPEETPAPKSPLVYK